MEPAKYAVLDSIIQSELVPAFFDTDKIPAEFYCLFSLPVKDAGPSILSPTAEGAMNHETLLASTQHLVGAILQEHDLNLQEHACTMNKGQREGKKRKSEKYDGIFNEVCTLLSPDQRWGLKERAKEGGEWLNMMPQYKNNNVLGEGKFRDGLLLRYLWEPQDLPSHCDGCRKKFGICHALDCKT
eukprot:11110609-Ditylum_brightwellii.AAC.1